MFCPKCGATLKDGAKFCHGCGFNMVETPAAPQPQQQQQPNEQQPAGPGFDISKTPMSAWIIAGAATLGMIATFLPWFTFRGWGGWWAPTYWDFGYLVFIIFLGIVGVAIFGDAMKMHAAAKDKIISFGGIGAGGFCFIDLLRSLVSSYLSPGFGLIIALLAAVGVILFGFKVIKLK
jgi:hypothetical protein